MKTSHRLDNNLVRGRGKLPHIKTAFGLIDLLSRHSHIVVKKIHKMSEINLLPLAKMIISFAKLIWEIVIKTDVLYIIDGY